LEQLLDVRPNRRMNAPRDCVKVFKYIGVAWGVIYLGVGVLGSFTINNIDTYASITLLGLTFVLPLPITVAAVRFPKSAGIALILCVVASAATFFFLFGVKDTTTALSTGFYIPNLVFGVAYIMAGAVPKETHAGGEKRSF